jgi:hypothetical protein
MDPTNVTRIRETFRPRGPFFRVLFRRRKKENKPYSEFFPEITNFLFPLLNALEPAQLLFIQTLQSPQLPLQPPQLPLLLLLLNLPSLLPLLLTPPLLLPLQALQLSLPTLPIQRLLLFSLQSTAQLWIALFLPLLFHLTLKISKNTLTWSIKSMVSHAYQITFSHNLSKCSLCFLSIPAPPSHLILVNTVLSATLQNSCNLCLEPSSLM